MPWTNDGGGFYKIVNAVSVPLLLRCEREDGGIEVANNCWLKKACSGTIVISWFLDGLGQGET